MEGGDIIEAYEGKKVGMLRVLRAGAVCLRTWSRMHDNACFLACSSVLYRHVFPLLCPLISWTPRGLSYVDP